MSERGSFSLAEFAQAERDAFRRGAEAMREAAVSACLASAKVFNEQGLLDASRAFQSQSYMLAIMPLPLPEPKP